ncbi:LOW QUALITY PROTEIN: Photoreceptor ankyrin repeat protein [Galemys pyrenaicus]|uniref:Photoreceptor ankyrin repeat protein n=1 Tax=Galemys pyrenaicus TaxID=202257 RepID=A0A8J6A1K4_GALPY|nr:LOW QUALITY PROTEIN: Photoreceptor ankyrin repeat protein [Galemys pyrenaicus]
MSETLPCLGAETPCPGSKLGGLYWACVCNDASQLQVLLDGGVFPEEATQVDSNGRVSYPWVQLPRHLGFRSIVTLLSRCPFLDVNQQDKEGDTALMLAVRAGARELLSHPPQSPPTPHQAIPDSPSLEEALSGYPCGSCVTGESPAQLLLGPRPGVPGPEGLTALMKAAVRNRSECMAALLLAGADLTAVDPIRGKMALEWAALTGSFDTVRRTQRLLQRPRVKQLGQHYQPSWPALSGPMAQAQAAPSLLEHLLATLSLSFVYSPQEGGVLDHLVTITTSLASPFLTTACHTPCPDCLPALGTRSKSVPELLGTSPPPPPGSPAPGPWVLSPHQSPQRVWSEYPQQLQPRGNTIPRPQAPKILLSKMPSLPRQCRQEPRSTGHHRLALPVW